MCIQGTVWGSVQTAECVFTLTRLIFAAATDQAAAASLLLLLLQNTPLAHLTKANCLLFCHVADTLVRSEGCNESLQG